MKQTKACAGSSGRSQVLQSSSRRAWYNKLGKQDKTDANRLWQLSKKEKEWLPQAKNQPKGWVRDLTQENIHPQPGPSHSEQHRFCSLNTQGYNNLYSFIQEADLLDADMLCSQETNLTKRQAEDLIALARSGGYRGWACLGEAKLDSRNRSDFHGGLVTLIRSSLPAHRITENTDGATALLMAQVGAHDDDDVIATVEIGTPLLKKWRPTEFFEAERKTSLARSTSWTWMDV